MFSRDRREFDDFVITIIINHQNFIMQFTTIINDALVNTR